MQDLMKDTDEMCTYEVRKKGKIFSIQCCHLLVKKFKTVKRRIDIKNVLHVQNLWSKRISDLYFVAFFNYSGASLLGDLG